MDPQSLCLAIVGESGTGKTTLATSFLRGPASVSLPPPLPTGPGGESFSLHPFLVDGLSCDLHLLDTAGSSHRAACDWAARSHPLRPIGFIVTYATQGSRASFEAVQPVVRALRHQLAQARADLSSNPTSVIGSPGDQDSNPIIVLVGTHREKGGARVVTAKEGKSVGADIGASLSVELSATDSAASLLLFQNVVRLFRWRFYGQHLRADV